MNENSYTRIYSFRLLLLFRVDAILLLCPYIYDIHAYIHIAFVRYESVFALYFCFDFANVFHS